MSQRELKREESAQGAVLTPEAHCALFTPRDMEALEGFEQESALASFTFQQCRSHCSNVQGQEQGDLCRG